MSILQRAIEIATRINVKSLAVNVKNHDLQDNMDISRLNKVTEKDLARIRKCQKAYSQLKNHNNLIDRKWE